MIKEQMQKQALKDAMKYILSYIQLKEGRSREDALEMIERLHTIAYSLAPDGGGDELILHGYSRLLYDCDVGEVLASLTVICHGLGITLCNLMNSYREISPKQEFIERYESRAKKRRGQCVVITAKSL